MSNEKKHVVQIANTYIQQVGGFPIKREIATMLFTRIPFGIYLLKRKARSFQYILCAQNWQYFSKNIYKKKQTTIDN